jgi:preprotein translocase subunit SecF
MQLFVDTNIQFLNKRKVGYVVSGILIAVTIVSIILHGGPKYNIDFTGGTLLHLKFENEIEIQSLRAAISSHGFGDSEIKHFGAPNEIAIRTGVLEVDEEKLSRKTTLLCNVQKK